MFCVRVPFKVFLPLLLSLYYSFFSFSIFFLEEEEMSPLRPAFLCVLCCFVGLGRSYSNSGWNVSSFSVSRSECTSDWDAGVLGGSATADGRPSTELCRPDECRSPRLSFSDRLFEPHQFPLTSALLIPTEHRGHF